MKANEERENCGVFRVKDTQYVYIYATTKRALLFASQILLQGRF